jgi:hypothetical protein
LTVTESADENGVPLKLINTSLFELLQLSGSIPGFGTLEVRFTKPLTPFDVLKNLGEAWRGQRVITYKTDALEAK